MGRTQHPKFSVLKNLIKKRLLAALVLAIGTGLLIILASFQSSAVLAKTPQHTPELIISPPISPSHRPAGCRGLVGLFGLRLSAGERQRLAIARALLKEAPVLILDEACANLDAALEKSLLERLYAPTKSRSLLMLTHHLAGMETMDEILVIENGRVVERGRHSDLFAARGLYRRLWDAQQGQG